MINQRINQSQLIPLYIFKCEYDFALFDSFCCMIVFKIKQNDLFEYFDVNISFFKLMDENNLHMVLLISKKKHVIVKFIDMNTNTYVRLKYIEVANSNEISFYRHALENINQCLNLQNKSNLNQQNLIYGQVIKDGKTYIYVNTAYIQSENLQKIFVQNKKPASIAETYHKFMLNLPLKLIDLFIQSITLTTFILNQSNVYIFSNDILLNLVSFVGMNLIFLEKEISLQQFRSIYSFLDSNIFERKPFERIGHQQKIKNFAAMLLTFIINRPIKLLQCKQFPQTVSVKLARQLMKQSPKLYQKFLNIKLIKQTIREKAKLWNGIELNNFFHEILVEQKNMAWSEIHNFFYKIDDSNNMKNLASKALNNYWNEMSRGQKKWICQKRIVQASQTDEQLDIDKSSVLLIMAMGLKVASLKNGSILSELGDKRSYDMLTSKLITRFIDLLFVSAPRCQAQENHVMNFHQIVLQFAKSQPQQQEENLYSSQQNRTGFESSQNQQYIQKESYQINAQGMQVNIQDHFQDLSKNQTLDETIRLMKSKMTNTFQAQGNIVKIEHQRLKSLKAFEGAFR